MGGSKNKRHGTWNINLCFLNVISIWNITLTGVYFQSCREQWCSFSAADVESCLKIQKLEKRRPERQVSKYRKIPTGKNSVFGHSFQAVKKKGNFQVAEAKVVWSIVNISIQRQIQLQIYRTKPDSSKQKEECIKFDSVAKILNPIN